MHVRTHIALVATAAAGLVATAAEAVAAPAFCQNHRYTDGGDGEGDDPVRALAEIVGELCRESATTSREAAEKAKARWTRDLGLDDAGWADAGLWATRSGRERVSLSMVVDHKKAPSAYDAVEQYVALLGRPGADFYLADVIGARLTEVGRMALVQKCMRSDRPSDWAACQHDLAAIDTTKLVSELKAASKYTGYERTVLRLEAFELGKRIAAHKTKVDALRAKDPGYARMFEIAAAASSAWTSRPPAASLIALADTMDDARSTSSRSAYAGCEEPTTKAFAEAVGGIPLERFSTIKVEHNFQMLVGAAGAVVGDPAGYLAAVALYGCRSAGGKPDVLTRFLGNAMNRWPGFRGPRTAAQTELVRTPIEFDDRGLRVGVSISYKWFQGDESTSGGGRGAIKAVKKKGATATIEYVTKTRKEKVCSDWKDTKRIATISASGAVYYEYDCLKYSTITIQTSPDPQTVSASAVENLKPGMTVLVIEGLVVAAWPKDGGDPVNVLGVARK